MSIKLPDEQFTHMNSFMFDFFYFNVKFGHSVAAIKGHSGQVTAIDMHSVFPYMWTSPHTPDVHSVTYQLNKARDEPEVFFVQGDIPTLQCRIQEMS